ncbi:MAG: transposase [Methyloprofundus sp.]|nr:transposase [Methyloprofundus sp.]
MKFEHSNLSTELQLFCPRRTCLCYQSLDNKITKDGTYTTKHDGVARQMLYCVGGQHRFSETGHSKLFGKHGSFKEYEQAAKLSCHGVSTDAIADVLDKDPRTIAMWQRSISKKANVFHEDLCLTITLATFFLQMDELWSYLGNKRKQLWVFVGFEVESRFWINFELGSRTTFTATKLMKQVNQYFNFSMLKKPLKITTDKLAAYKNAIESVLGNSNYVYLQIVKQRIKMRLITVKKNFVKGTKADFTGKSQNTSYIERFNLTLRQRVSYLQRKSLGYCKNKSNFNHLLWINLYDYNYRHYHKSLRLPVGDRKPLRFKKQWNHRTPAMAMGVTQEALTWRLLFLAPIQITH